MKERLRNRVEAEAASLLRDRVDRLRRTLDSALEDLAQPLEFPLAPGDWGAAEGTGKLQTLRDAADGIARGGTQREVLTAMIDAAAAFSPRAALFVLRGSAFNGWTGLGFLGEGGFRSEDLPHVSLPAAGGHLLAQAIHRRGLARAGEEGPGPEVAAALGRVRPGEAIAVPLMVRGRPVAVLYGDSGSAGPAPDGLAMEVLARLGGLAMERTAAEAAARRSAAPEAGNLPPAGEPIIRGHAAASSLPTPPEDAEMQALLSDLDRSPRREAADGGLGDEHRRRLADARRFAHLLVSEILLYNEEAVAQGRRHRDLAQRLKKEIDRSRQAYEARVSGLGTRGPDYFLEELVRQLAQGDAGLLR